LNDLGNGKFGPKREEVAEDWRRLHNEELHDLTLLQTDDRAELSQKTATNNGTPAKRLYK